MNALALLQHGATLFSRGDYDDALACFGEVLRHNPRDPYALGNRAAVLTQLGRHEEALQALSLLPPGAPGHVEAQCNRAHILRQLGRPAEALACADAVLAARPAEAAALHHRVQALLDLGRPAEAAPSLRQLTAIQPGDAASWHLLGHVLAGLDRCDEALPPLRQALALQPDHPGALHALGFVLLRLEHHAEALEPLQRLLRQQPDFAEAQLNLGVALLGLHRVEEALPPLRRAVVLAPHDAATHDNLGTALDKLGRHAEALQCFEHALQLDPAEPETRLHRALALLREGDYATGLREFEQRWHCEPLRRHPPRSNAPRWLGETPLDHQTILVLHEQGFGDTLQFARYLPLLAQRAGRVLLDVPAALRPLLRSLPAELHFVEDGAALPPHDCHIPLMSLPLAFATTLDSIPAHTVPYLKAEAQRSVAWAACLGPRRRPRIGLVWAGRQYPPLNVPRDMSLQRLRPLFDLDADFISLQKDIPAADRAVLEALPQLQRLGESLDDFADTAALIDNLDLVLAVDTAVVHLAGAMAKPVWLMNRYAACWRWLRQREDSPWYPGLRQFRQPRYGDWEEVVTQVHSALSAWLGQIGASGAAGS